jgi:hypothetical protein
VRPSNDNEFLEYQFTADCYVVCKWSKTSWI